MLSVGLRPRQRYLILALLLVGVAPARAHSPQPVLKPTGALSSRLMSLAHAPQRAGTAGRLDLPATGAGSLLVDGQGSLLVYVWVQTLDQALLAGLAQADARVVDISKDYNVVTVAVAPQRLAELAALPGVKAVQEALAPATAEAAPGEPLLPAAALRAGGGGGCPTGTIISEGDTVLRAAEARVRYGVDGGGVTVGVLSGSFNRTSGAITAADDIATGDLPGPGNPCGRAGPVAVVAESRLASGRDEGRAMLQIVHDLAPGANLAFATASDGLFAFAENIRRLRREARADVIVDDYYYPEEPFFQDGPVGVAIQDVVADGAIYVTAGGNIHVTDQAGRAIGSYEAPAYRPTECPTIFDPRAQVQIVPGNDCHDFDAHDGADATLGLTLPVSGGIVLNTQWSEPWFGVQTDLDVYLVDSSGVIVARSDNVLGLAPFEFFAYTNPLTSAQQVQIIVARFSGGAPRFKLTLGSAALAIRPPVSMEYADVPVQVGGDVFGPTVVDHGVTQAALAVAAAPYAAPFNVEPFSSHGPATIYWAPADSIRPAGPLPAPELRQKPDLAAVDGVRTTFYGRAEPTALTRCDPADAARVCRFYGTSAAAPHVAAVAALMKQRANLAGLPLDGARTLLLLQASAAPMNGPPEAHGAGLADAVRAVGFAADD